MVNEFGTGTGESRCWPEVRGGLVVPLGPIHKRDEHDVAMADESATRNLDEILLEVMRLERRALELKRRHERVIEAAAWFPNVVNERQERELAAKRAAVDVRAAELEETLRHLRGVQKLPLLAD